MTSKSDGSAGSGANRDRDNYSIMPPPDISQQDSLALAQAKALAESGIDPSKPGPASAFLEV